MPSPSADSPDRHQHVPAFDGVQKTKTTAGPVVFLASRERGPPVREEHQMMCQHHFGARR